MEIYLNNALLCGLERQMNGTMGENLVIVESPAKAKTIEKFLGEGYTVRSSYGNIRDLEKKGLGIDIDAGFEPRYEVPAAKRKTVSDLKSAVKKADTVWLASDEDREGEAIAWHLSNVLGLDPATTKRIVFHEITKSAILEAIKSPRTIDMNLVMAQQARRVLDRLVGFELSPILWKKIQPKLSAGRVQSVALRLIVDREREISAFESKAFFRIEATFTLEGGKNLQAVLNEKFETEEEALAFLNKCRGAQFSVTAIETKKATRTPAPPFTTSTLQQEAARKLGFSLSQTMSIAQKLYESGLITYMRTDSTNLSSLAINTAKETVTGLYGEEYSRIRHYQTRSKSAQEAHEAIRPTYISNLEIQGTPVEKRLYSLIWKRTAACQMADAVIEKTEIEISCPSFSEKFTVQGEQILFDGFLKVYSEGGDDEEDEENATLPRVEKGQELTVSYVTATQRFSQRPPRYSESSLVKKLEELGIGRPSTYATTSTTLQERGYVIKGDKQGQQRDYVELKLKGEKVARTVRSETFGAEKKKLLPENIGMVVTDFLAANFTDILDYGFTAKVEEDLDRIAAGSLIWNNAISEFYRPFHDKVEKSFEDRTHTNAERLIGNDPATGKPVYARIGRFGPLVQKGANDDPDKQFVSLGKGQLIENITLEEALHLLALPRRVGSWKGFEIIAAIGRFGPYVKYDGKYVSLGKGLDPYTVTEEQAIALIEASLDKESKKSIAEFEASGIQILNGRYGPYIRKDGANYKIPRGTDPYKLTETQCIEIIENTPVKKK